MFRGGPVLTQGPCIGAGRGTALAGFFLGCVLAFVHDVFDADQTDRLLAGPDAVVSERMRIIWQFFLIGTKRSLLGRFKCKADPYSRKCKDFCTPSLTW